MAGIAGRARDGGHVGVRLIVVEGRPMPARIGRLGLVYGAPIACAERMTGTGMGDLSSGQSDKIA